MSPWLLCAGLNLAQLGLTLAYLALGRSRERWQIMAASLLLLPALIVAEWTAFSRYADLEQTIAVLHRRDDTLAAQMITLGVLTRIRDRAALECHE